MNVAKVLAVLAALLTLRVFAQRMQRRSGEPGHTRDFLAFALPPLITGGPAFIAMPASLYALREESVASGMAILAWAGGAMLAVGLVMMYMLLMRQQREIADLRDRLASENSPEG